MSPSEKSSSIAFLSAEHASRSLEALREMLAPFP